MGDLEVLMAICPPPRTHSPTVGSRSDDFAPTIPSSHRELIETYGVGCFDEFIWIFGEGIENPHLDISTKTRAMGSILRTKECTDLRAGLNDYSVDPGDLVQWGASDNGDSLMWLPVGEPARWPTVIIEAGQLSFAFSTRSSAGVLVDLLTGALRPSFFPEDFPSDRPMFSANPYI
ncbi:hypothetical protein ACFYST_34230 [Kitasatospora sp. NPDC004614]|uniref:hypothetical protein n=1 Tax=unclassified Kitasatospora TaxID=2633591 RepID=UPI003673AC91